MAAIFQIRRGTTNVSLVEGELYLHQGSGSLQFGSGSANYNVLTLDSPVSGEIILDGNITASNAYFSGDVAISGNLFLGNNTGDNISVPGVFTTNLVPGTNIAYDLGTSAAKWRTIYADSVSASFNGNVNGIDITDFSTSVDARLDSLQEFTASVTGAQNHLAYFLTDKTITSYVHSHISGGTFGLGTTAFNPSNPERLMVDNGNSFNIATFQTSQNDSFAEVNIKNFGSGSASSADLVIWNDISTEESNFFDMGMNSSNYTDNVLGYANDGYLVTSDSDVYVGAMAQTNTGSLHLFGGGLWNSSSISIYKDGTIGINTDKFDNNATTIPTAGYAVEVSGGVKFDNNVDFLGNISSSTISGIGNVTAYSQSIETKFTTLAQITSSIVDYTASLNIWTASAKIELNNLELNSASVNVSVDNLNNWSASAKVELSNLETKSASVDTSISNINSYTSSLKTAIGVNGTDVTVLGNLTVNGTTTQINSTQVNIGDNILELNYGGSQTTAGIYAKDATGISTISGSLLWDATTDYWKGGRLGNESKLLLAGGDSVISSSAQLTELNSFTSSANVRLNNLESTSASVNISVSNLNAETASLETRGTTLAQVTSSILSWTASAKVELSNLETKSASVDVAISNHNIWSASAKIELSNLELTSASVNTSISNINNLTSSALVRFSNLEATSESVNTSISNLNGETASLETRAVTLSQLTSSMLSWSSSTDVRISNLETKSASVDTSIININLYTASVRTDLASIHQTTASLNTATASINNFTASMTASYLVLSASVEYINRIGFGGYDVSGSFSQLFAESASLENRMLQIAVVTSSLISTASNHEQRLDTIESQTGSYARTDTANIFNGTQTISGSLYITQDLIVFGSSSIQNVSASAINIGANTVQLNTNTPSVRFGGMVVADSGSNNGISGSLLWDSQNNHWVYSNPSGSNYDGAMLISGPKNTSGLGNEVGVTPNMLIVGQGEDHVSSSNIYHNNTITAFGQDVYVTTGSLYVGTLNAQNGVVSGSSQINVTATTNYSVIASQFSAIGTETSSLEDRAETLRIYTSSLETRMSAIATETASIETRFGDLATLTGSNIIRLNNLESTSASVNVSISNINSFTSSINTTIKNKLNLDGVISSSTQLSGTTIQNLSGSFTGSFKGPLNGLASQASLVITQNSNTNQDYSLVFVISGSNGFLQTYTDGLSNLLYNPSTNRLKSDYIQGAIEATNGVVSGSSQITLSGTTGYSSLATTFEPIASSTHTLVTGSSQITLSSTTGGSTTSDVQFGSLGIGTTASGVSGEIRAAGDITAYYSSDERLKENIQPIENALSKVEAISGNTYDWKEGFETIHSHKGHDLGVIAQQVQSVLPEVVTERETGYLAVDYVKLVPVLIEAIKELSAKVKELESK